MSRDGSLVCPMNWLQQSELSHKLSKTITEFCKTLGFDIFVTGFKIVMDIIKSVLVSMLLGFRE